MRPRLSESSRVGDNGNDDDDGHDQEQSQDTVLVAMALRCCTDTPKTPTESLSGPSSTTADRYFQYSQIQQKELHDETTTDSKMEIPRE